MLSGCITTGREYPKNEADQVQWYLDGVKEAYTVKNYSGIAYSISKAVTKTDGKKAVIRLFKKNPNIKTGLVNYLSTEITTVKNKSKFNRLREYVSTYDKHQLFESDKILKLQSHILSRIRTSNITGKIDWLLSDNIKFEQPHSDKQNKIIFNRSLAYIENNKKTDELMPYLVNYLTSKQRTKQELQSAKNILKNASLRRAHVVQLKTIYPDLVKEYLDKMEIKIQLTIVPQDRLLEEDLRAKLVNASEYYKVLRYGEESQSKTVNITVEKLLEKERQIPVQTQTISYTEHEVDFFESAFYMPRNSTYMFDLVEGGVELEYGYVVRLEYSNEKLIDDVVRGTLHENFTNCKNKRIVNVFGGTSSPNFIANDHMQSMCDSSANLQPSYQDLKDRVQDLLVDKITSVKILAKRK